MVSFVTLLAQASTAEVPWWAWPLAAVGLAVSGGGLAAIFRGVKAVRHIMDIVNTELTPNKGDSIRDRVRDAADTQQELIDAVKQLDESNHERNVRLVIALERLETTMRREMRRDD